MLNLLALIQHSEFKVIRWATDNDQ